MSQPVDFFDVLPVHPQPQPFESLTSYLMRLAEANHITSIAGLSNICFPGQGVKTIRSFADYPPVSLGVLGSLSSCSNTELLQLTFYKIGRLFARSTHPQAMSKFLKGVVGSHLRYCPHCLTENKHYRLPWRFAVLTGCLHHRSQLMDQCGHCGHKIPLLADNLKVGICVHCGKSLDLCHAKEIDESQTEATKRMLQDIEVILSRSELDGTEQDIAYSWGIKIRTLRSERRLAIEVLAESVGKTKAAMLDIERGSHRSTRFTLHDCFRICEALNIRLVELIPNEVRRRPRSGQRATLDLAIMPGEDILVQRATEAIGILETSGKKVTAAAIAGQAEVPESWLSYYETSNAICQEAILRSRSISTKEREALLLCNLKTAVTTLRADGLRVTQHRLAQRMDWSKSGLRHHGTIDVFLREVLGEPKPSTQRYAREDLVLEKVSSAIIELTERGDRVTAQAVADTVGMSRAALRYYPRVKSLLSEVSTRNSQSQQTKPRKARGPKVEREPQENSGPGERLERLDHGTRPDQGRLTEPEVVRRILDAKASMLAQEAALTRRRVIQLASIPHAALKYPQVRETVDDILSEYRRAKIVARTKAFEDEWNRKILEVSETLVSSEKPTTQASLCAALGVSPGRLYYYPELRGVLKQFAKPQLVRTPRVLLDEDEAITVVRDLATEAASDRRRLSQSALAEVLGVSVEQLRRFPRLHAEVKMLVRQNRRISSEKRCKELLERLRKARVELESREAKPTKTAICRAAGVSASSLGGYPEVTTFLGQIAAPRRQA